MASFIQNMLWNSVSGFVEEGKRTVGGYAGDALIKAGDLVEGGGRSVGNGIERKATGLGSSISGQTHKPSAKALPSTARRPVAHRSNSLPASTKPSIGGSGVPLGAKKYGTASTGAAKKTVGGVAGGARNTIGGVTSGVARGSGGLAKPVGGVVGGMNRPVGGAQKTMNNTANTSAKRNNLPKPFPQSSTAQGKTAGLPKPYSSANGLASTEKKTAVRPGQTKPFVAPKEKDTGKKPYPGTNTLPGQASRTPVKKYKPMQRYEAPAKAGEVKHLSF